MRIPKISWFDLAILSLIFLGGFLYLHDVRYWSVGYVGDAPCGDAQFWWDGAVHFAKGIFEDNPGKGYRPGYFVLAGLTLPVLGWQFSEFYPYFLMTFLMVISLFYLALRHPIGRWVATFVVCMIVFNPFTAEWLATSTTDAMGLLLHIAALTCLLVGVRRHLQRGWMIGFAILFALATLTRPLMTPFIVMVCLGILLKLQEKQTIKKWSIIAAILIAFCIPVLLWMGVQKLSSHQWSLSSKSSNDSSAFYAASDPDIQQWNLMMYDHIYQLAKEHYQIEPDDKLLNHTFWVETVKNYFKYPGYHLKRAIPDIFQIASFSPKMATRGNEFWRKTLFLLIGLSLTLVCLLQRRLWQGALLLTFSICVYHWPSWMGYLTIAGGVIALLPWNDSKNRLALFLLSAYWWVGLFALYLTGGVWGPPLQPVYAINALGYRLGAQVFFMGDLLAAFFLVWIYSRKLQESVMMPRWLMQPRPVAGKIVLSSYLIFLIMILSVYLLGTVRVIQQAYAQNYIPMQSYPSLVSVKNLFRQYSGSMPSEVRINKGGLATNIQPDNKSQTWIFTGAASPFIWNLPGQQRSQLLVHTQAHIHPFTMGPGYVILEIPQHINANDWSNVQGAFIVQATIDHHNTSNLPYYLTVPAIRGFIPLTADKQNYDLNKVRWFSLSKNATQLESEGALKFINSQITWAQDSGVEKYQRRFFLTPRSSDHLTLRLSITPQQKLIFSYSWGAIPGKDVDVQGQYEMKVSVRKSGGQFQTVMMQQHRYEDRHSDLHSVEFTVPAQAKTVEISFNHLMPDTGIWIYEFNSRKV